MLFSATEKALGAHGAAGASSSACSSAPTCRSARSSSSTSASAARSCSGSFSPSPRQRRRDHPARFVAGGLAAVRRSSGSRRSGGCSAFEDQLPDLLITIAASLKAGHSFKQGLQAVVDEGQPPASEEFKRVLTETRLGRPMDDALAEMAERIGSKNFDFVITAVTIQRQVGGSLAGLFDMVADTVRQRQQFARKIKALTAMGRMSALRAGRPAVLPRASRSR